MWKEKIREENNSVFVNNIYKQIFGSEISIKRSKLNNNSEKQSLFDRKFAIDSEIILESGCKITVQEKVLQFNKSHYNQLTLEYLNNTLDENHFGDFFHFYNQLYFFGYESQMKDGLFSWYLLDTVRLMLFLNKIGLRELREKYLRNNPPPAKSNFFAIPMEVFENTGIIMFCSQKKTAF